MGARAARLRAHEASGEKGGDWAARFAGMSLAMARGMTKKNVAALFVGLLAVAGCAAEPDVDGVDQERDEETDQSENALSIKKPPTPFCLPGEVVKCTLGPPPVCRCEPVSPPVLESYVAR